MSNSIIFIFNILQSGVYKKNMKQIIGYGTVEAKTTVRKVSVARIDLH